MNEKLTSRQIQSQNTYDKIYNIAIELITKNGFDNITVAEICTAADVSIGSFYNHFKSKYDILNEIFKLADDYFLNIVAPKLNEDNTKDNIIKFFYYYAQYSIDRGLDFVKQLYMGRNNLFTMKGRSMQIVLQKVIENGQNCGEISIDMTAEQIVRYLFISVRGIVYDWALHEGEYDLIDTVNTHVNLLIKIL